MRIITSMGLCVLSMLVIGGPIPENGKPISVVELLVATVLVASAVLMWPTVVSARPVQMNAIRTYVNADGKIVEVLWEHPDYRSEW